MRPVPIVIGCLLIATGLMTLLGGALTSGAGFGGTGEDALIDALFGMPGAMLGGGVAVMLFGLIEKRPPTDLH